MGKGILVVDDDLDLQEAMRDLLEMEGYDVRVAADGAEALVYLEDRVPEVVLLDLMMPRMNGYELMDELGQRQLLRRTKVVIMTADANAEDKAEQVGAYAGIVKPFNVASLLSFIERLVTDEPDEPDEPDNQEHRWRGKPERHGN